MKGRKCRPEAAAHKFVDAQPEAGKVLVPSYTAGETVWKITDIFMLWCHDIALFLKHYSKHLKNLFADIPI